MELSLFRHRITASVPTVLSLRPLKVIRAVIFRSVAQHFCVEKHALISQIQDLKP